MKRLAHRKEGQHSHVLVTTSSAGLLATVRSRCQKVAFRTEATDPLAEPERRALAERLEGVDRLAVPDLLDWAEEYRGARAPAASAVAELLETASALLRRRVGEAVAKSDRPVRAELAAFAELASCRKSLAQRNANPQMVAERALLTLRDACAR